MFTSMWIFVPIIFTTLRPSSAMANITTCEEFERGARFNPYDLIDSMWKIFYFWADNTELSPIVFSLVAKNKLLKFKEVIDAINPKLGIEWNKATLMMYPKAGTEVLFLHAGTPGAFRALVKVEERDGKVQPYPEPQIKFADIRMKLVGKYLGMMCCEDLSAYALARLEDVPLTEPRCLTAASTLGYQGVDGRSYLSLYKTHQDEL